MSTTLENSSVSDAPIYLIAASGTGGHIFPALYIAQALRSQDPSCVVEFIGSGRPLEEKLIDAAGYRRHVVGVKGVKQAGMKGLLRFVTKLPSAIAQVFGLIRGRNVRAIVGAGGYVSVVPIIVGRLLGKTTWIHEAELHPGLANWFVSVFATRMSLAFEDAKAPLWAKKEYTGHPVRPELAHIDTNSIPGDAPRRILVTGGSQGARSLDQTLPRVLGKMPNASTIQVCHQARPENIDEVAKAYADNRVEARVLSFIDDMAQAYGWSDIIVSRSGAGSVMEIATVNRPAILVPYPFQQGTHQTDNAKTLSSRGKAELVEEGADFEIRLEAAIRKLLSRDAYEEMKTAPVTTRNIDAALRIARGVIELSATAR